MAYDYDLFVLGTGPSGQRAAIQAAKLDKRVGVAELRDVVGGVCINTGTIPSKTLREAALYLSGYRERAIYGASYAVKQSIGMADLCRRTQHVIGHEIDVTRHQLQRNRVEIFPAAASFTGPNALRLVFNDGRGQRDITAEKIVLAVGTVATRDGPIPFDGQTIFTSDDVLGLQQLPRTLAVVGAGVIGCEYATIFASLGVRVTLIDKRTKLLPFIDEEVIDSLAYHMRQNRITLRLGEEVSGMDKVPYEGHERVRIKLASGKEILTGNVLYSVGRTGAVADLHLEATGVVTNERGQVKVNDDFQTSVPHIYAVGDVIGFPSLASTSMQQGRNAARHAFGLPVNSVPAHFPYGIYTIPEISVVGKTEEELTAAGIPYEVGKASYNEIARGLIVGDTTGLLKLMFHLGDRTLLGVAIIGEGASELVHIGQAVLAHGGTIDYFLDTVFNYPTLAEAYKTAAFDGMNKLG